VQNGDSIKGSSPFGREWGIKGIDKDFFSVLLILGIGSKSEDIFEIVYQDNRFWDKANAYRCAILLPFEKGKDSK
jgi:hypothetical protein